MWLTRYFMRECQPHQCNLTGMPGNAHHFSYERSWMLPFHPADICIASLLLGRDAMICVEQRQPAGLPRDEVL